MGKRQYNPGDKNKNGQFYMRDTGQPGTDNMQYVIVVRCLKCKKEYGTNGSNFFQCKCPYCQGGKSNILVE